MSKSMLSLKNKIEVFEFLKTCCRKTEDGKAEYLEGWNDAKVAVHFGVTAANITGVRNEMIGKLRGTSPIAAMHNATQQRFEKLEERVSRLEDFVTKRFTMSWKSHLGK